MTQLEYTSSMFGRIANFELGLGKFKLAPSKITKHALFSGSILMIGGNLGINAVNYLYHLLMGRVMGPEVYGELGSIFSILYIISIVPISTSFAIVKFVSSAKSDKERAEIYHSVRRTVIVLAIVLCIAIVGFSNTIANFLHLGEVMSIVLIGPILFFMLITLVNKATLQGVLNFWGVVAPDAVTNILKLLIGIILVYIGYAVTGAVVAILVGVVFAYLLSVNLIKREIKHEANKNYNIKPILKYAFPVLLQSLAFTALFSVDLLLVKHFLPASDAGLYAALSTLGKIIFFAAQPVTGVMFPIVATRQAKGEKYFHIFLLSAFITIGVSLTVLLFFLTLPKIAIGLLYGSAYLSASGDLFLMGLFLTFYTFSYFLVNYLLSLHQTKVVVLPLIASIAQIVILWQRHESIREVLLVNTSISFVLMVSLLIYTSNQYFRKKLIARFSTTIRL